ncbi:HNH endonuclease [Streptomyces lavendulocolor]|uniref:HNH endonuclease n=1 Tax=Streptomyces lavendulocolor TaxID=67316 RepID=UPI003C2B098B
MVAKGVQVGPKNPNWKGGRTVASNGYVLIKRPEHHRADRRGYVYEHILVAEQAMGRPLRKGEQVHHKNHVKTDNRPENLAVKASRAHHALEHRKRSDLRPPGARNPLVTCACGCGTEFRRYDQENRPRRFVSGHNLRSYRHG